MLRTALMDKELNNRIFQVTKNRFENPFFIKTPTENIGCYYQKHSPDSPLCLVFFHDADETVADYLEMYGEYLDNLHYHVFIAEYPGYGLSSGTPTLFKLLENVPYVIKAIESSFEQIVVLGKGLGSLAAIHAIKMFPQLAGLILDSPIADLKEYLKSRNLLQYENEKLLSASFDYYLNNLEKISVYNNPILIFQGVNDNEIKLWHAQELYRRKTVTATLKVFEKGTHKNLMYFNWKEYLLEVYSFLWKIENQ